VSAHHIFSSCRHWLLFLAVDRLVAGKHGVRHFPAVPVLLLGGLGVVSLPTRWTATSGSGQSAVAICGA
jgi:hypothetical protein